MNWLAKCSEQACALMRVLVGLTFSFHGMQKILIATRGGVTWCVDKK